LGKSAGWAAWLPDFPALIMLDGLVRRAAGRADDTMDGAATATVMSASCVVQDLFVASDVDAGLLVGDLRRWSVSWRTVDGDVVCPLRDLGAFAAVGVVPTRRFAWRTGQRHRPGLQYMVSTGRHHGFESLAEQRLLLALDFAGAVSWVLGQPFRLRYTVASVPRTHVPDLLAVCGGAVWLFDVRPAGRVKPKDLDGFRAAARAADEAGWRYAVVTAWRPQVMTTVEDLSAQRRSLQDPLAVQEQLIAAAAVPVPFGRLVAGTSAPAVVRAHALHLLWHRRLDLDLSVPLSDASVVRAVR
jgi:hypothetical protein